MPTVTASTGKQHQRGFAWPRALLGIAALLLVAALGAAGFVWLDAGKLQARPALLEMMDPIILAQADELLTAEDDTPGAAEDSTATAEPEPEPLPPPRALLNPDELGESEAHLCFFSFNTPWEYRRMTWFVSAINKHSPIKIRVSELQAERARPLQSIRQAIERGIRCDGVVLSGHFDYEYYGDRAKGDLELDDLEELCCEPRYSKWFAQVKALWLQGCNTIKYTEKSNSVDDDDRVTGSPLPFMVRLMDVRDMEDSVEDMHDMLRANKNDENYALDFQRIFPEATIFGWTNLAPGDKAGSHRSIPYHIAQISRVIDDDPRVFSNPITSDIPPDAARRYAEVLYGLLKRPQTPREDFPPELAEHNFIQGWRDHGNRRYKYSFDNPSVRGYPALIISDDEVLRQTKGLACLEEQIDNMKRNPDMLTLARYILADPELYKYNTYFLEAMLKTGGPAVKSGILSAMRANEDFLRFVEASRGAKGYRGKDAQRFYALVKPPTTVAADPVEPEVAQVAAEDN